MIVETQNRAAESSPTGWPLVGSGRHFPALDGLRGIAVVAVVAYHLWPDTVPGGWLGVSLFFTLSGFLVVGLIDDELTKSGKIDLATFYRRRIRRLLPAALLTIGVVVVATALLDVAARKGVAEAGLAAVLNVANWQQMTEPGGYAAIFDNAARPLGHMWSLSIEEQFYLTVPLAVAWTKRPTAVVGVGLLMAMAGQWYWWGTTDAYLATPVRMAEILAGAGLALLLRRVPVSVVIGRLAPVAAVIGVIAFLVAEESAPAVFRGLPAGLALAWVILVAGCVTPSWFSAGLSNGALRWLGARSYGIYLIHWPLIELTKLAPWAVVLVTLVIAELSYRLFEDPIRRGRRLVRPVVALVGSGSVLALGCLLLAVTLVAPSGLVETEPETAVPEWFGQTAAPLPAAPAPQPRVEAAVVEQSPTSTTRPPAPAVPLVLVLGDSTGRHVAAGMQAHGEASQSMVVVDGAELSCSPLIDPELGWRSHRVSTGYLDVLEFDEPCRHSVTEFGLPFDAVLIVDNGVALADHLRLDGEWVSLLDPSVLADLEFVYRRRIEEARSIGARTIFTTIPAIINPDQVDLFGTLADPERRATYNALVQRLADEADDVDLFDLGAVLDASGKDGTYSRPDGIHVGLGEPGRRLAAEVIDPAIREFLGG